MPNPTAADIMAREATLSPEADIYDAITKLLKSKLSGAPVVDGNGGLIGMLSERDCLKVIVGGALDGPPWGPCVRLYEPAHPSRSAPTRACSRSSTSF